MEAVYLILNLVNGKCYIGSTNNYSRRYNRHILDLNKNKHHCIPLQRAWNKYGTEKFKFFILEQCISNYLELEQYYLDLLNPDYNLNKVASGGCSFRSIHTRKKIAMKLTGRVVSLTTRQKLSSINSGKVCSHQTKVKISQSKTGTISKKRLSVLCISENNKLIKRFESIQAGAKQMDIVRSNIVACLKGRRKTAGGYIWKYNV